jgi:hypothetical protein
MPTDYMRATKIAITKMEENNMEDKIYFEFFIHEMHFTCEDCGEDSFGVYNEGMLIAEIDECDYDKAVACAVKYYKIIKSAWA